MGKFTSMFLILPMHLKDLTYYKAKVHFLQYPQYMILPPLLLVTIMNDNFWRAASLNGNIFTWYSSSASDMDTIFDSASSFNHDLSNWYISSVSKMNEMFSNSGLFNGDISTFNASFVTGI